MNAQLENQVVFQIQKLSGQPCSRGISKVLSQLLKELEDYRNSSKKEVSEQSNRKNNNSQGRTIPESLISSDQVQPRRDDIS